MVEDLRESYFIYDLSVLDTKYAQWYKDIKPFYAVKCNPNPNILKRLFELGCGFDCASANEIQAVLDIGASPNDIIYANPCKRIHDLVWAYEHGVMYTTIDSISEIDKIYKYTPSMECLLRIRCDDSNAKCILGNKYGAEETEWERLISHSIGKVNICGISFHVGSGSKSKTVHQEGIAKSLRCIELCKSYGLNPSIIDIGGGFQNDLPDIVLPDNMYIIAEPGRYFAEHVATLYTPIIGVKNDSITIDDSLYGSFNNIMYDHAVSVPTSDGGTPTTVFGCSCDGIDVIGTFQLPKVHIGDSLEWKSMGAYTSTAASQFNGMNFKHKVIVV
jgi:ornithine decarboxylase